MCIFFIIFALAFANSERNIQQISHQIHSGCLRVR